VLLGLCLLTGVWLPGAVLAVNGLLIAFLTALVFNLARGLDVTAAASAPQVWAVDVHRMVPAAGCGVSRNWGFFVLCGISDSASGKA